MNGTAKVKERAWRSKRIYLSFQDISSWTRGRRKLKQKPELQQGVWSGRRRVFLSRNGSSSLRRRWNHKQVQDTQPHPTLGRCPGPWAHSLCICSQQPTSSRLHNTISCKSLPQIDFHCKLHLPDHNISIWTSCRGLEGSVPKIKSSMVLL